jgi:hypothetical protein
MDQDFLKKEEEFRRENKQLELKTKEILQKVDDIMVKKMQDLQLQHFKPEMRHIDLKDLNLPRSVDEMGAKGMVQFYKSKIKTLQDDLAKSQTELKNKVRNDHARRR